MTRSWSKVYWIECLVEEVGESWPTSDRIDKECVHSYNRLLLRSRSDRNLNVRPFPLVASSASTLALRTLLTPILHLPPGTEEVIELRGATSTERDKCMVRVLTNKYKLFFKNLHHRTKVHLKYWFLIKMN